MIPLSLFKLPSELLHVYCAVRSFDWQKEGEGRAGCTASAKTIAERIGKGERQTRDNLQRLADCGAVRIEPQKGGAPRVLCTPDNFDPAKIPPAADRRTPQPRQSTADGPAVHRRTPRQSTAGGVRQSTADELETVSRDKKQRQEVETPRAAETPRQSTAAPLTLVPFEPERPKAKRKATGPVVLPDWLPETVWSEWRAFRVAIRKTMTEHTERLQISKLGEWRAAGHDPVAIIRHSIMQGWTGLIEPKGKPTAGGRWTAQPNRPSAREDQEFTEADLDRLLEESK